MTGGELIGDGTQAITGVASLGDASAGKIAFFSVQRYMPLLRETRASAVFVPIDFREEIRPAQIRVANPSKAFEKVVLHFAPAPVRFAAGIHPTAVIALDAKLGADVSIQAYVVIESGVTVGNKTVIGANSYIGHETVIGPDCMIYPRVTIRERNILGARVTIHSGAVIGADGFGFEIVNNRHKKVPQVGIVQIDDDVEIGANTAIDRARFGRTWIQEGAKIDNLVQIAHNVVVGKHAIIAGQAGIAGSSRLGDYVMVGGQVGITGHVEISEGVSLGAKTGVSKSILDKGAIWWGVPAQPIRRMHEQLAWIRRLGQFFERLKAIEKKLGI